MKFEYTNMKVPSIIIFSTHSNVFWLLRAIAIPELDELMRSLMAVSKAAWSLADPASTEMIETLSNPATLGRDGLISVAENLHREHAEDSVYQALLFSQSCEDNLAGTDKARRGRGLGGG